MDLPELAGLIEAARDVLRVDSREARDPSSDPELHTPQQPGAPLPDRRRAYLDRLTVAAQARRPRRRLLVTARPVPEAVAEACRGRYRDNVAAGEDVRVLEPKHSPADTHRLLTQWPGTFGDVYVLDGELVAMTFTPAGQFVSAARASESEDISTDAAARIVREVEGQFEHGRPFTAWWADNPDLH